ncbi:MAG: DUF2399 domain-containing protein [Abitibacteriaceae bacterium]|nr:DUF2399 domain-containing protein [Abditibacteriaceae bacterium]
MNEKLKRATFSTDRALEFFSEKELTMQIGHARNLWAIALVKELIDNALDACESAGIAPQITVIVEPDAVSVQDNGPGLPVDVLTRSLDYLIRVSDKLHYISPTRGQQGNALKCVWAAPFVVDGEHGQVEVTTHGQRHLIDVTLDRIAQRPRIEHSIHPSDVKNGTIVKMYWSEIAGLLTNPKKTSSYNDGYFQEPFCDLLTLVTRYAGCNPHATFILRTPDCCVAYEATSPDFAKWWPNTPTSPHWYNAEQLKALIAGYLSQEQETGGKPQTVREFVAEFNGLSGTAKQKAVTDTAGLSGATLRDMVQDNDLSVERVKALLTAMQSQARPIKAAALGVLGEDHIKQHLIQRLNVSPDSIRYRKFASEIEGLPYVVEISFGVYAANAPTTSTSVTSIGLNFAPALTLSLDSLDRMLYKAKVYDDDPVHVFVHLVCPRFDYKDRGKSFLNLPATVRGELGKYVESVCKSWTIKKRQADRQGKVSERELDELRRSKRAKEIDIKEAAYSVMKRAYLETSVNNRYPANARQVMYAARPEVLRITGGKCWKNSTYFTQTLLPDFVEEHPELTADWDVVFDARGHIVEPHTGQRIDLGTVAVRRYIAGWSDIISETLNVEIGHGCPTSGPGNRFKYALFIEKEGFDELIKSAQIASRYDIAIMSTKGMSVTAARSLVEKLSEQGVTILVMHDFDKSGFSILHTLRNDTRRFRFKVPPRVIDLGLRLADVTEMNLQSEIVEYKGKVDPRINLRESGATEEECDFLVQQQNSNGGWSGQRVELNAMMRSDVIIQWIERKLEGAGVCKYVPEPEVLDAAYRRAVRRAVVQQAIDNALCNLDADAHIEVPEGLSEAVRTAIVGTPQPWDEAVYNLAKGVPSHG